MIVGFRHRGLLVVFRFDGPDVRDVDLIDYH